MKHGPKDYREFLIKASAPGGLILATQFWISQSLIEDTKFDIDTYQRKKAIDDAKSWNVFDSPACTYTYLTEDEYDYEPGPHQCYDENGQAIPGLMMFIGRVRVTCEESAIQQYMQLNAKSQKKRKRR